MRFFMQTRLVLSDMLAGLHKLREPLAPACPAPPEAGAAPAPLVSAPVRRLLGLLHEFAGFRATPQLQRKLEKTFAEMAPAQLAAWVEAMAADPLRRDLTALVEDLTNHETYFFRDMPQLEVLEQHVLPELVRRKLKSGDKTLRIWSAACATGEEAWTLALLALQALLQAGVARETRPGEIWLPPDWRLEVLGTDISRQAIRTASTAGYRTDAMGPFRDFPPQYRRFFDDAPMADSQVGYRLVCDSLRRHVSFELFNLMSANPPRQHQDLVLCRNVLIYLEPSAHAGVQAMLARALRPGGYLMLGVVDRPQQPGLFNDRWFSRCVIHERK